MIGYNDGFGEDGNIAQGKTISEIIDKDRVAVGEAVDSELDKERINVVWCDDPLKQFVFERR